MSAHTKRKLTARLPDGTWATRTTHRTYTHVVAVQDEAGWGAIAWAGTQLLAERRANEVRRVARVARWQDVRVLPVESAA